MNSINSLPNNSGSVCNPNLYKFLATNYDITDLARKISASKYAQINKMNLKKVANESKSSIF